MFCEWTFPKLRWFRIFSNSGTAKLKEKTIKILLNHYNLSPANLDYYLF